ncbi:ATP-binding protein [Nocardioides nematodiphilus]|uniref:ATP-binding protein n=1 Tax=Nocardioides nematodiphilus TaxID=2849669 RepID=UPI001CD9ED02|nr:ATP-binding protein [Nocardioides nematodiphilus]MCA1982702.1 ATP-binding protein [Nocardioides nematodiphilus]
MPPARSRHTADRWWVVDGDAAVPAVRRAATALSAEAGFSEDRVGEIGIVVTELATNLVRHAGGGEMVLRLIDGADGMALRVLAIDAGPGSRNINALISDGASTRGTLGIGLGACRRLASAFDVYSVPALGTIAEAVLHRTADTPDEPGARVSDLTRPLSEEGPCGDAAAYRLTDGIHVAMVADGLGHGPLAAEASQRAAEVLAASDSVAPAALLDLIHGALRGTRGAAVSVLAFDPAADTLIHAGIGNIVVRLAGPAGVRTLPTQPGIVGHRAPQPREQTHSTADSAMAVMHSDGLSQRWGIEDLPGILAHRPAVVCAALLRKAASRRDDSGLLVLRTVA